MSRPVRLLSLLAVAAAFLLLPAGAAAHPLGNFSTNQLLELRFDRAGGELHYVLDQAEIPSFQQLQRYDSDGDGRLAGAETGPLVDELLATAAEGIAVTADGRPVDLGPARAVELSFPAGQAGLRLTRLEADFRLPATVDGAEVEVANDAYASRVGWRAIRAVPGAGTAVDSSVPADDPTGGLRDYPADLLESPRDQSSARFTVTPGNGTVSAPGSDQAATSGSGGGDGFAATLTGSDAHGLLLLVLLATAFGWGALHALSPGHGTAMVAGYLAGSRGRPRHALALGLTVTATHTVSVFALGLVTLLASEYVLPEDIYPWLGVASGLLVVGVGLTVMRSRYRRWRAARTGAVDQHGHDHGHSHSHGHDHPHDAPIRGRELLGLGVSGGLVPCPSALVVLIAAISQHRVGLGMGLIFAFSLGLAATVSAVGLVTIWGGRLIGRLRPEQRLFGGRLTGALPALSASAIVLVGVLITYRAMPALV